MPWWLVNFRALVTVGNFDNPLAAMALEPCARGASGPWQSFCLDGGVSTAGVARMKNLISLKAVSLAAALCVAQPPVALADVLLSAPLDLVLPSLNVSGNLVADAGRDLSTSGSNQATGHGVLTIGRDAALGDVTVGNNLSVSTGRHLSIAGPIVSGGATTLNVGDQLQVSGAVTTGTSLQATVGGNTTMAGAVITSGAGASITTGGALAYSGLATAGQVFAATAGTSASFSGVSLLSGTSSVLTAGTDLSFSGAATAGNGWAASAGGNLLFNGSASAVQGINMEAVHNLQLSGQLQSGAGAVLSAGTGLSLGPVAVQGNLSATGGSTVDVTGPVTVTGHADVQAGNRLTLGSAMTVGQNLSLTAPSAIEVADTVQAQQLAVTTDRLEFAIDTPSSHGGFQVTHAAAFGDLDAIIVSFAGGFSFMNGQVFDLIQAGALSGISEALFSVENLDPLFGYTVAVGADAVRFSVFERGRQDVPEPGTLSLLALALAVMGRRHAQRRA